MQVSLIATWGNGRCGSGVLITIASTLPRGGETLDVTTGKALAVNREAVGDD